MPGFTRNHDVPKYRRERPEYVVHPDGLITVEQKYILPSKFAADEEDMNACDDRLVKDLYGNTIYMGPLRPLWRSVSPATRGWRVHTSERPGRATGLRH